MKNRLVKLTFLMAVINLLPSCGFNTFRAIDEYVGNNSEGIIGASACEIELKTAFANTWHPFLKANCVACHIPAGGAEAGKGAFAASDINVAYNAFKGGPPEKIAQFAVMATHKAPYSGPQHQGAVSGLTTAWATAQVDFESCVAAGGGGDDIPAGPRVVTAEKLLTATAIARTITFDLGTEIVQPSGTAFAGAQLRINVQISTLSSGETSYVFTNPVLQAGSQALSIKDIKFAINGVVISTTTTYASISRSVPANQNRTLANSQAVIQRVIAATDTVSLSIGEISATDFAPPTYTQLTAAAGPNNVLRANCFACHGVAPFSGNLNLADRNALINNARVIPFFPDQSLMHQRMVSTSAPMPATGNVSAAQIKLVRDWILDGAPQ